MAYVSEITKFLNDLLEKQPELAKQRMDLRATWWDKPQSLEEQQEREQVRVKQSAYVYFDRPQAPK